MHESVVAVPPSAKKRQRKAEHHKSTALRISEFLELPAIEQFATHLLGAIRPMMQGVAQDIIEKQEEVVDLCSVWADMLTNWEEKVRTGADHGFSKVLASCLVVFQCSLGEESARPTVASVRAARRCIIEAMHSTQPAAAAAKNSL